MTHNGQGRAQWSSRLLFVLVASGSAVGLGNIWKFPYMAGSGGGGAFVLVYLLCVLFIGLPIFVAELYIGQQSQANPVKAFEIMHKPKTPWRFIGLLGVLSAYLILSFYSVVGGWVLDFSYQALTNQFGSLTQESIQNILTALFADPGRQIFWQFIFLGISVYVVAQGVVKGIERASKVLMPVLGFLLFFLFIRALFLPGAKDAVVFLFVPDFSLLTPKIVLEAVGQAFFTLSLGIGAMMIYGSYLNKSENLLKVSFLVSLLDTGIALVAGFVVFSIVFTFKFQPEAGPALMFQTLPMIFSKMPASYFVAVAFFLLVAFAALTSAFSLLEIIISWKTEQFNISRKKAAVIAGIFLFGLGLLTAMSTNILSQTTIFGLTFFGLFDKLTTSVFMPLGSILFAVFYGWILGPKAVKATVDQNKGTKYFFIVFLWLVRIVAPGAVGIMMIKGLFY
ncbi:sodium-dependent transporter [bacterium]|nr:sodium-dependent transporter [bacterium]MBU1917916.1 sodium-dependent transporter [bacterium]